MFHSTFLHEKVNYGRFYEYGYACNVSENYQRCLYEDYHQSCQHLINTCLKSPRYRCWSTQMLIIDISTLLNWLKIYNSVDKLCVLVGEDAFLQWTPPESCSETLSFLLESLGWTGVVHVDVVRFFHHYFFGVCLCVWGGYYHLDKMSSIFTVPKVLLPLA